MALIRPDKMAVTAFMRIVFSRAEREIIADINRMRVRELVDYGAQAALRRVQGVLGDMVDESWSYVPTAVERVFTDASHAAGYASAEALSATQTAVCEQLVSNLLGQIDEAAEAAFSTTQKVIEIGRLSGDIYREKTLGAVLHQEATGKGFQASAGDVVRQWNAGGITAFTDRAGRKWSLTDYGTMATRTTAAQAQNAAVLTTYPGDLWQISRIGSTCPVCAVYEGRVYSRSGTNPDYPPLSAAFGKIDPAGTDDLTNTYLEIHPNCNHALIPYTTMGKTQREIKKDKDFSSFEKNPVTKDPRTEEQRKAYQDKVDRRRRYLETKHQFERYREALPDDMPKTLATFERHKRLDDDKYKEWMKAYRAKGVELRKEHPELFEKKPKTPPKPPTPVKTVEEWRKEYTKAEAQTRRTNAEIENSRDYIRRAENQNRDLRKQLEEFPESRFAQRYRDRIALNEETIRTETEKVKALEMEHARAYAEQVKAEDAIVSDFLQETHTIQDPSMAEGLKNTNPHFEPNRGGFTSWDNPAPYNMNCQRCVFTYEARRRGYDVTAQPTFKGDKLPFNKRWTEAMQGTVKPEEGISAARNVTVRKNIEKRMAEFGEGSRAIVSCQWKGCNYGHVFIAEQVGGKTMFIDPQTGKTDIAELYFKSMKPGQTELYRIDDKKFSPVIEQIFSKGDK